LKSLVGIESIEMRIIEYEAKALLRDHGLPVPRGEMVMRPEEAQAVARVIGRPVVVKAQIPIGGRMKAGGVRFANTPASAAFAARKILGKSIHGFWVERVSVDEQIEIAVKVFVGATYDAAARNAVLLASTAGGIDVESASEVVRRPFSTLAPVPDYVGREVAAELGFEGRQLLSLGRLITRIAQLFILWDALLLEVNPLILDPVGQWWIADVHLEIDDDATRRQANLLERVPHSAKFAVPQSDFERQAIEIDSTDHRGVAGRLLPFDGNLGLLIGGGGASLTIFDAVLDAGLRPANYCEIGGNPSVWKTKELTKLILSQPNVERLAVIMNVVSNTRVDLVARGAIKGVLELNRNPGQVIAAFRVPGSWEDEGQAILRHYGVPFFGRETSIDQVVEAIKRGEQYIVNSIQSQAT
jgi:succinyl-CoA synthetase beta subunit/citryl-CoA synthetase large subunit